MALDVRCVLGAHHRVDDEAGLVGPAAVEGRLAGPGAAGDGVHGQSVVADVEQQLERGLEDLVLAVTLDAGSSPGDGRLRARGSPVIVCMWDETKPFRFIEHRTEPGPTEIHSRWSSNSWPSGRGLLAAFASVPVSGVTSGGTGGSASGRSSGPGVAGVEGAATAGAGVGAASCRCRASACSSPWESSGWASWRGPSSTAARIRRRCPGCVPEPVAAAGVRRHRPAGHRLDGGDAGHARDHHGEAGERDLAPGQVPAARRAIGGLVDGSARSGPGLRPRAAALRDGARQGVRDEGGLAHALGGTTWRRRGAPERPGVRR